MGATGDLCKDSAKCPHLRIAHVLAYMCLLRRRSDATPWRRGGMLSLSHGDAASRRVTPRLQRATSRQHTAQQWQAPVRPSTIFAGGSAHGDQAWRVIPLLSNLPSRPLRQSIASRQQSPSSSHPRKTPSFSTTRGRSPPKARSRQASSWNMSSSTGGNHRRTRNQRRTPLETSAVFRKGNHGDSPPKFSLHVRGKL